ncbi:MAG: PD40 domain-containing protein [Bacteroidaceae bacterium]|nr:PD40 domain-containing protein [Bacteroidaceae bacterium]
MKRKLLLTLLCAITGITFASETPRWLRNCKISPDGTTIAFTYKGDIFTVPASGGEARQITSLDSYDTTPIWSNDGENIVFSSNRNGSFDLYIVSKKGGTPKRLTTNAANEYPEVFLNDKEILYTAQMMPDAKYGQFPNSYNQVYKITIDGGRPQLFSSEYMESISIDKSGKKLLYNDKKGYEDKWRKHHRSSITRDIWMTNVDGTRKFTKLSTFNGEDRNPVWSSDGDTYYYLSEQDGTSNIYRTSLSAADKQKQITKHSKHPVRFLSAANDGTLCYAYDGDIYTVKDGSSPKKVNVTLTADLPQPRTSRHYFSGGASAMAVSKETNEVAFVQRGDVFVTTMDHSGTRRITDTPEQERNVDISADGRTIIYSAERNGQWGIYKSELVRKEDKYFTYATEIKEEPLIVGEKAAFQPTFSPDGKEIAFLQDRTTLCVYNIKSKKIRTVLDGKYNYSYSDGDQTYTWSPDSKWFLAKYIDVGGWNNTDIVLVKADGKGEMYNLTESGYCDDNPRWVLDGKAMIWASDRAGYRSHGSWGAHRDEYIMFFDADAYDKFRMNKEELAITEEMEKLQKEAEEKARKEKEEKEEKKKKKDGDKKDEGDKKEEEKELKFDLENRKDRIIRLTTHSSSLGDAVLTKKGDKLLYLTSFEGGVDLWERNFREGYDKIVVRGMGWGKMTTDKDMKYAYIVAGGQMKRLDLGNNGVHKISYSAEFNYRPAEEREYIFNHVWQQVKDKFYDPKIHGVDWEFYKKEYKKFLPYISNNVDFADMLSELLGELNASHTGARASFSNSYHTATLGAFYDDSYDGDGLKIKEILKNGPLTRANSKIKAGAIIEKVDGKEIKKGEDYYPLFENLAGKKVLLTIYDPQSKERYEEWVKPITRGGESGLLYKRWVEQRRHIVDSLSGGRIGYVHVASMNSESFRETYSDILGRYRNKEAVLVDTRHNGGGWLHDDLATLLNGKEYQRFMPRGKYIGSDPFNKWNKPSAVLVCEDNYSNAHGFPTVYKALGIGKLIGTPVPGTMTAVWWERQINGEIVFGIPQVGVQDNNGKYLENQELQPDILVYNSPEDNLNGKDTQLEAGVKHLLEVIGKKK